jgi:hypothetical protein
MSAGKLRLESGVWLSIFRLRLRGLTASHAPSFPLVALSPGAHVLFQDCLLHRTACVPIELVYDSIRAPATRSQGPAAALAVAGSASVADRGGTGSLGVGDGERATAEGTWPAGKTDIELLRQYCFRTVAAGRQCRPVALQLWSYSFETQRRAAGSVGTGGFLLHARNTTVVW